MTTVYLFCLVFGFAFTVLGAVIGQFASSHSGAGGGHDLAGSGHGAGLSDLPAHPGGTGGGASHGHGPAGGGDGTGGVHLPLLSPTVISFFLATFGGTGLLFAHLLGPDRTWLHLPLAALTAAALGVLLAYGLYKITGSFERNRLARASDALAGAAEVSVTVPRAGVGAVAYLSGGTRQVVPARSGDGREHRQGSAVRVLRVLDGVAIVGALPPEDATNAGEPVWDGDPQPRG